MKITKIGLIFDPRLISSSWWKSHAMAPSAVLINPSTVRVYLGCWDENKISRIGYVDIDANDPKKILSISEKAVFNIGEDGCFDENGVFPAHSIKEESGRVILFYTGFQLGHKIRHYNFGGAAISYDNGDSFNRVSKAPVLDRADEGLFVRAGQSAVKVKDIYHNVYSAGSGWHFVAGENRPVYDVFYQASKDPFNLSKEGKKIISVNKDEHGLGRPQIVRLNKTFYVFYTRRVIEGMKYHMGYSRSTDLENWERCDSDLFRQIPHGQEGEFDSEMVYFPCVVQVSDKKALLFYSGNYFGRDGLGCALIENF